MVALGSGKAVKEILGSKGLEVAADLEELLAGASHELAFPRDAGSGANVRSRGNRRGFAILIYGEHPAVFGR